MKRSIKHPQNETPTPSESMGLRRDNANCERFNGSCEMLSLRDTVDERKAAGLHQAILTVRLAATSVWIKTIPILRSSDLSDGNGPTFASK